MVSAMLIKFANFANPNPNVPPPRGQDPSRYDLYPDRLPSPPKPASVRADVSAISEFARVVKRTYKPVTNSLRTLGHENYIPGNL